MASLAVAYSRFRSSAGSRDSPLTNHGVLQAQRLGQHLAAHSPAVGPVTHLYASNLQRAVRTAQAVAQAQASVAGRDESLDVVQVPELREKDFGSDEGKRFGTRASDKATVPSESRDSMENRAGRFIDTVLVPAIAQVAPLPTYKGNIVIVAHGIILNVLLRCLLARFGPDEVSKFARPVGDAPWRSEWLASWSNTGYLEATLRVAMPVAGAEDNDDDRPLAAAEATALPIIQLFVDAVNCIEHLQSLKKTRGGIGSAASDSKQRTMESFFARLAKKPKGSD